jgi:hypothetical protein
MAAFAMASCAQNSVFSEPILPATVGSAGPISYKALSEIPARPEVPQAEMREETVEALTADRAATAQAASRLRDEPFKPPDPLPPPGSDSP